MYHFLKNSRTLTSNPLPPHMHTHTYPLSLSLTHTRTHAHIHIQIAAELVCDNDDLSFLCGLIDSKKFSLTDDWTNENITWTVFAPTDKAFKPLTRDGGLPDDMLEQILQFHAVKGQKLLSTDLPCKAGKNLITMSNGKDARIMCNNDLPLGIKGGGKDLTAIITEFNVTACNGVIHVIDDVLLFN